MSKPINKVVPLSPTAAKSKLVGGAAANDGSAHEIPTAPSADQKPAGPKKEPLVRLQDASRQSLSQLLQKMFDNADDALFALADKAQNNSEQNVYFESMRDIRLKRRRIEAAFSQSVPLAFDAIVQNDHSSDMRDVAPSNVEASSAALALVQNDELEEQVAVDGMVARFLGTETDALRELTQRIDSLVAAHVVDENNNPVGPRSVCNGFMHACSCLEVDIKSKLVVFKLFEKQLLKDLDGVHQHCNALLIELGVLPGLVLGANGKALKNEHKGVKRTDGRNDLSTPMENGVASARSEELLAVVRQLMSQSQHWESPFSSAEAQWFTPGQAQELSRPQLFEILTEAQTQLMRSGAQPELGGKGEWSPVNAGPIIAAPGNSAQLIDVHKTMRALLESRNVVEKRSLPQLDFDAINLVSMLFQFILDDDSLATAMKAQLARLQIPVLKAAMLDKSFFGTEGHPARQLLNKMATAAIGWTPNDSESSDPLLKKITESVDSLLQNFDQNTEIFQTHLHDFELFLQQESRRATLLEKRAVDAADGKAKAEQARAQVQEVLNDLLKGNQVPSIVEQLLREAWSNVMFLSFVRNGEQSGSWQMAVETARQLIWSVSENETAKTKEALMQIIPDLLRSLREGLTQVSFDSFKMNTLFSELEKIHLGMLSGIRSEHQSQECDEAYQAEQANRASVEPSKPAADAKLDLVQKDARVAEPERYQENDELDDDLESLLGSVDELMSLGSSLEKSEQSESAIGTEKTVDDHSEEETSASQTSAEAPFKMVVGSWIELLDEAELKARAKLAAITKPGDQHVFVNRAGMKVMVLDADELRKRIQARSIKILDDGALFDRALQSVIGNLRQRKKPELH